MDLGGYETDSVTRISTNLDDLSPEIIGAVMDKLLAVGALDVWFTAIQMKKNRPAVELSVLCEEENVGVMAEVIFGETSAFGLRMEKMARLKLERRFERVETEFGEVTVKLGLRGGEVIQVAPEFASCQGASERTGKALRFIYAAAVQGYTRANGRGG